MVLSNILEIFNPPSSASKTVAAARGNPSNVASQQGTALPAEDKDCLPCLATSSAVMVLGGAYLTSGLVFATKDSKPLPGVTPRWRAVVRGGGAFVVGLGLYRGLYAARLALAEWNKEQGNTTK